ncbi:hypothetical protein Tco_1259190, partial [Tanacetum coccineum]
ATRGEEIDLTLFPLAPGPYHMPYLYEGVPPPLKALDRRTESLLPLELLLRILVVFVLDCGTATRGEEIDLTLFPLAPGPYYMPYPYEGVSSPLYTREEWNGRHASESNILCKDIFKDPDVCKKALDRTITPAELRRTESFLPLELSNRVHVLSALLVSHGYELNSRYANFVSSKAHLQEKFDKKKWDVKFLRSEVTS